ncbi:unnamed protein product [Orchesella dallaii]|uniref:Uncharacterized protein n=1 Tax=Orchesella dallaii TaxID=48710 RepID=A0ABP1QQS6_9HEXA
MKITNIHQSLVPDEDASSSSDGGSSHSSDYHNPPPRKKPVRVNYVLSKSFPNLDEAKAFAKESKKWSPHYSRKMLNNSTKHHYHCRFLRDCPARMHLLESETGTELYVADIEHPHPLNIVIKPYGMSDEVKAKINHLYQKGMTAPRSLLRRLKADGLGEPTKNQVTRYIQVTFKDKKKNV